MPKKSTKQKYNHYLAKFAFPNYISLQQPEAVSPKIIEDEDKVSKLVQEALDYKLVEHQNVSADELRSRAKILYWYACRTLETNFRSCDQAKMREVWPAYGKRLTKIVDFICKIGEPTADDMYLLLKALDILLRIVIVYIESFMPDDTLCPNQLHKTIQDVFSYFKKNNSVSLEMDAMGDRRLKRDYMTTAKSFVEVADKLLSSSAFLSFLEKYDSKPATGVADSAVGSMERQSVAASADAVTPGDKRSRRSRRDPTVPQGPFTNCYNGLLNLVKGLYQDDTSKLQNRKSDFVSDEGWSFLEAALKLEHDQDRRNAGENVRVKRKLLEDPNIQDMLVYLDVPNKGGSNVLQNNKVESAESAASTEGELTAEAARRLVELCNSAKTQDNALVDDDDDESEYDDDDSMDQSHDAYNNESEYDDDDSMDQSYDAYNDESEDAYDDDEEDEKGTLMDESPDRHSAAPADGDRLSRKRNHGQAFWQDDRSSSAASDERQSLAKRPRTSSSVPPSPLQPDASVSAVDIADSSHTAVEHRVENGQQEKRLNVYIKNVAYQTLFGTQPRKGFFRLALAEENYLATKTGYLGSSSLLYDPNDVYSRNAPHKFSLYMSSETAESFYSPVQVGHPNYVIRWVKSLEQGDCLLGGFRFLN